MSTAIALGVAALLALAAALSPARVGTVVGLDWRIGDMAPILQGLRLMAVLGAALLFLRRHRLAETLRQVRPIQVLGPLTLACVSTALALAVAELGLRLANYPFDGSWTPSEAAFARYDADLGWSYLPDRYARQTYGTDPREITMYFDTMGIRAGSPDHAWDWDAPSVLFIGDSFTMGHGVDYEEAFPARAEAAAGRRFQAVNLGVEGYGTDQALLSLQRYIDRFRTRAVVYTYIADHVRRNANADRRLLYPDGNWPGTKPLFGILPDGGAYLKRRPARVADLHTLRLVETAQLAWARWGARPDPRLTTALVRQLKRLCDARGVRLLVVYWSFAPDPRGLEPLAGTGVDVLDLTRDAPPEWPTWAIPGDWHPSAQAHDRVGRLVAERLTSPSAAARRTAPLPSRP